jgi:hypothetical protein
MPRKKQTILIPSPALTHKIAKTLKRYRDANLWSENGRKHIADDVYHIVCEYIGQVNQGIINENPLAPQPKKRQVLSLTPEEFKAKQEGKEVKEVKKKPTAKKKPVKKLEQNANRSVRPTRKQPTIETNE